MTEILDIGSGTLNSHKARGTVNLDLSTHPANLPERFINGDANSLPFADESFDGVSFLEVIEHVEHPAKCLREINRVLKQGGYVEVSTPNPTHWRILLRHLLHLKYVPWREHIAMWGIPEMENLLKYTGFTPAKSDYINDKDRERFEGWRHKYADKVVHRLSLCHALTGRSIWVKAYKKKQKIGE